MNRVESESFSPLAASDAVSQNGRILFAACLRGVAAGVVLVSHYLDVFWTETKIVGGLIGAPPLPADMQPWFVGLVELLPKHVMGQFGVALFFLISGFVIPFGLLNRSRTEFLIGRLFRIWPTYAVGFCLTLAAVAACSAWYGQPPPFSLSAVSAHLLFIRDLLWLPSIDGIVWTLEIEVKFYLLCALIAPSLRRGALRPLLAFGALSALLTIGASRMPSWLNAADPGHTLLYVATFDGQMICFMLIGTVFCAAHRRLVGPGLAAIAVTALLAAHAVQWPLGLGRATASSGLIAYFAALSVFALCFAGRTVFQRAPRPVMWLADISYPLYVVHGVSGYALMRVLLDQGLSPGVAILVTTGLALALSWFMHRTIELPTQAFGKSVARWCAGQRGAVKHHEGSADAGIPASKAKMARIFSGRFADGIAEGRSTGDS